MRENQDYKFFLKLLTKANMGWWEADVENENYICSEYISQLLGLENGYISFKDFNKLILKEEQHHTTVHSFDNIEFSPEIVYLLDTVCGPVWIRSKACFQETDENGKTKIYGIAETQDGPNMASAYQALQRNEHLLHNIYKKLPVGIELYNKEGVLIDANDKELEIFHVNRKEDLLGINIFDNPIFPEEMKEKLRKNEDADFCFRYDFSKVKDYYPAREKEGTIDLLTKVVTLFDEDGNPINYLLINADKTETTVAYNKIQEFESYFELVGDYAKVGYAHFNVFTNQGYAQHSWYRNLGEKENIPMKDIVGIYAHVHPEDRVELIEFIENVRKGNSNKIHKEIRILHEDGSHSWTHVNLLVRQHTPQTNTSEIICINYDITQLKQTEEMLIKAKDRAEQSDRLKSAFLANMSHEIRTPLNAIVGFSDVLTYTDNPEEKKLYSQLIRNNNESLLNIIDDVFDLSKIDSGHIDLHPVWFNLSELITECTDEQKHNIPQEVQLLTQYPAKEFLVEFDRRRIKQIVSSLISNALKYTSQGSVSIFYEINEEKAIICVTDTGIGIPEEKYDKIFERFEKLDSFAQGAGLGLSICKSIIEEMNGQIKVTSQVGVGSEFRVELPCHAIAMQEVAKDK